MGPARTSSITTRFLVEVLDQSGIAVDDLLTRAELTRDGLQQADTSCPLNVFDALWQRAAAHFPDIGLTLIERFPAGQMHIVTHLALRSADVRQALMSVSRYVRLTQAHDRVSVSERNDHATVQFDNAPLDDGRRHNPWISEHLLSMTHLLFSTACGKPLPLTSVSFRNGAQGEIAAYQRRFGQIPQFHAAVNALCFPSEVLEWPLQTHDAYLRGILEQFASKHLPELENELPQQVAAHLHALWLSGQQPSLATVAAELGISADLLRKRLAESGRSFRQLKDDSRRDLARIHLGGSLAIGEIAYLLGFSEPAALQHACKRWFGLPVGELRRQWAGEARIRRANQSA